MSIQIPFPLPSHGYALNSKMIVNLQFLVDQFNSFNSGTATWDQVSVGTGSSVTGKLSFYNSTNNNYIAFQPGVTGANVTYTLPITAPTNNSFLVSDGSDVLSWSTIGVSSLLLSDASRNPTWTALSASRILTTTSLSALSQVAIPTSGILYGDATTALNNFAITSTAKKILLTGSSSTLAWSDVVFNIGAASQGLLYTAAGVSVDPLANTVSAEGFVAVPTSGIPFVKKLLGTTNQITVTQNTNDWTLTTPQSIGTSSDVAFNSVKVAAGSFSACALRFNATNSGFYNSNTNEWSIAFNGTQIFQFNGDIAPFLGVQGDLAANNATFLSLRLNGATSGHISIAVPATPTAHTLTLPSAHGAANTVLTDAAGDGNLSWATPGSISGTVNSGTAGRLSLYATSTTAVSDTYVQNLKNITLAIAAQGSRSADLALTIPNPGNAVTSANVVLDQGNYTISGTWTSPTFVTPALGTPASGALTNCTSIPVANATGTLAVANGGTGQTTYTNGQLLIGNTTGNTLAKATLTGTTNQITVTNGTGSITLAAAQDIATGSSPTFVGGTFTGTVDVQGKLKGKGTATNDSATAGYIGESIYSAVSTTNFAAGTANYEDGTSISLTAGDWDVSALIHIGNVGTTLTLLGLGISSTTGNSTLGLSSGDNRLFIGSGSATTMSDTSLSIPNYRVSIASTTIHYLKVRADFTGTAPQYQCRLSARRVR